MQRDRQRLEEHVGLEKECSSDSDVMLGSSYEEERPPSQESKAAQIESPGECSMCTLINLDVTAFRCELCESARPGLPRKMQKLSQQPVDKPTIKNSKVKPSSDFCLAHYHGIDSSASGDAASITSATLRKGGAGAGWNVYKGAAKTRQELWTDIYAPKTVNDLCVNKKKVHEISKWLDRNASPPSGVFQKRLLFLCGPPGSGKSTTVRCIARQLGLLIKEWQDNSAAGKLDFERKLREDVWTPQASRLDDFSDFVYCSSVYTALPVATSRRTSTIQRKSRLSCSQQGPFPVKTRQLVLVESWPQSSSKENLVCYEKLQRIYQSVIDSASGCRYPVVCIYSIVQGSKIDLDHLSRKFSREVMHSPMTTVIHINAVTTTQLQKHLKNVAAQENFRYHQADLQNIIDSSSGDIRHALNMLQLLQTFNVRNHKKVVSAIPTKEGKKKGEASKSLSGISSSARDPFLSDFHVIGKLLYGKMVENKFAHHSISKSDANDITYDQILDASAMTLDRILGLVHENSIVYFTQVEDLSGAMELMSLCEAMVAQTYNGVSSSEVSKRSRDVTQAILTRALAATNENPAAKAFRPITRPRTFSAKQRMVSRREEICVATRGENGFEYACTGDVFAFEVEPFLTIMDRNGSPRRKASWTTFAFDTPLVKEVNDEIQNSDDD